MPGFQFAFLARAAAPVRGRRGTLALALVFCCLLAGYFVVLPPPARGLSSNIVISQVYGGGGATSGTPTYINDYVELFNRSSSPVTLTGYALQYGAATGNFGNTASQIYALSTVTIQPGKYLLIQVGAAGTVGGPLPVTPDQTTGNISMSASSGKIALTNTTTALGCGATGNLCTLPDARIVDSVSYGAANNGEGGTTVNNGATLANTQGAVRKTNGCTETDNNNSDFNVVSAPVPRNSGTAASPCTPLAPTLSINDVALSEGDVGTTTFSFTVSLTSAAPLGGVSFTATTADNTATTADNDYQFKTQNLTILEGQNSATFDVSVNGDMAFEPNESFFVNITAITGATAGDVQGQGTINNDDVSPLPLLSINDVSLTEGNAGTTTFSFTVSLSQVAGAGGVSFDIATQDGTATTANNDYVAASQMSKTIAAGQMSTTFDVTVNGDTASEPDETFTVNITNVTGANVSDGTGQGTIQNDDLNLTLIHDIQGSGETPNFVGQSKIIQGIVIGSFQTSAGLSGFFVEEEQSDWDGDANTSEGIFVFDGATPATTVNVGDQVTVTGTVLNFGGPPGLTELSPTTSVVVNSSGNPLPPVQTVTLPVGTSPAADLEKYEGMRVQFAQPLFVTDNDDLAHFGELSLAANSQLYIPTNSIDPNDNPASGNSITGNSNVPAVTAQQASNNNSRIILDDGKGGTYPNPIPFLGAGTNATIRLGDSVTSLLGVMSYGFGSYRIEPTGTVSFNALNPRSAMPDSVGSSTLRVVSFNVENYFATTGTGRGPDNATELTRKRAKVSAALAGLNADVIGLIELEKGTQAVPNAALNDIISGLNTLGVGTYAVVPTPTAVYTVPVGTDVDIKSGIIYRTSTVSTVGASFTDTTAVVGTYSRAPIAQTFQQTSNGEKFTFVINHFRSKGCPGTGGDADMGDGQSCYNDRRRNQAQSIIAFVNTTIVPIDPDVLVAGDLNAYGQEDPIDVFRAAGYADLIGQYVPLASQYSYTFSGETGRLDHVFATSGLASQTTGSTIWHINADEPSAFDYNTENKPDDRYAVTPFASADHNPVLVGLALSSTCPVISISPTTLPSGTYNTPYNQMLSASGGSGNYNFALQNGSSLPAGLMLSNTGVISGTPTQPGATTFTVIVTDTATNCTGNRTYTVSIQCPTINIAPTTLPNPVVGVAYNQTLTGSGGVGPYTFVLHTGSLLPPGLNLSGDTITGTPTQGGPFTFTIDVSDTGLAIGPSNCGGNRTYTITVGCPTINVTPSSVPTGTAGTAYGPVQFLQTGGNGAITWSVTSNNLPAGLTLNAATGELSGTPTIAAGVNITIRATDINGCFGSVIVTLQISCPTITVSPASGLPTVLSDGTVGQPYNQTFTAAPAGGSYTYSIPAPSIPPGLTFNSATGVLSGTPTTTGTFGFTVTATGFGGCTGQQNYSLTINCATISLSPAGPSLPSGTAGTNYSQQLTTSNTTGTVNFTLLSGSFPTGLTMSLGGLISGIPTQTGTANFTVKATDANNCSGTQAYSLLIDCQTITVNAPGGNTGTVGTPFSQTFTQTGGLGAITFSTASTLPTGITLATNGTLSGTPTQSGSFPLIVKATDANNCMSTVNYTLSISCPVITVTPLNAVLPVGMAGSVYNQTFLQSGGNGAVTFSVSAGTLPTGLTLSVAGVLSGTPANFGNFGFTVRATDVNNCFGERAYTLVVNPPCGVITINPTTLANGFQGSAYSQTLTATGGTAPYFFAVTAGSLPGGLTLANGGALTGTPTAAGTFSFTVTATDNNGCTGTRSYTVLVSGNGLQFYPLAAPVRLLDTRSGASPNACTQPNVPIAGGTALTQPGRSTCTIPANAVALTGNVTTVNSGGGFLTLFPSNAVQPTVASTNYNPNEIINNVFTVGLGTDGAFKIFAFNTTDVVVDVTGYYAPPATGGLFFHPLPKPIRLLETRAGQLGCNTPGAPIQGGEAGTQTQQARLTCDGVTIPAGALAIAGNATTVGPQGGGFLTIFPADAMQPLVASSNYNANQIVNGPFSVGLSPTGHFKIFTFATTDLVVDVLGYYSTEATDVNGAGLLLTPLAHPVRLLETRPSELVGCFKPGVPLMGGVETTQTARGTCDGVTIPANALGVVGNATVVQPSVAGFLTLWPSTATQPLAATSNYNPGDVGNRHFIVGLGQADGAFKLYSHAMTHLVIDLSGYFAP